jgi:hypothetical protein
MTPEQREEAETLAEQLRQQIQLPTEHPADKFKREKIAKIKADPKLSNEEKEIWIRRISEGVSASE